jgi:hypothetical protein
MVWLFMVQANWLNNIRGLGSWLGYLSFDGLFGFLQLMKLF